MPLVQYVFEKDCGSNKAGDLIALDQSEAEGLVSAGFIKEATAEDVGGHEEEAAPEQEAAITRAIKDGFKEIHSSLAKNQTPANKALGNFATPKEPIFKSTRDLLLAMMKQRQGDATSFNKLEAHKAEIRKKSPAGMSESGTGQYALIPEWASEIFVKVKDWPKLLDMTNKQKTNSLTYNMPVIDENSLSDGSRNGGILAYYVDEGTPGTTSFPAMTTVPETLKTLVALVPVTNQLLEDNNYGLDQYLQKLVGEEFLWQQSKAVISGAGSSSTPTGILNQASLVTITKEGSQTANTLNFPNLYKMFSRLWPASKRNAVWLAEPQVYTQLISMTFPNAAGTYSVFGHLAYDAHEEFPMRIFGKPVIECQMSPALGTVGDLILADLGALTTTEHSNAVEVAVADQVYFTSLQTVFRFVYRYDIKSPWTSAVTSNSVTYSPFIACQTRS